MDISSEDAQALDVERIEVEAVSKARWAARRARIGMPCPQAASLLLNRESQLP